MFVARNLILLFLQGLSICKGDLHLSTDIESTGVELNSAVLRCSIVTDQDVKELIWYKQSSTSFSTIYYYEPPRVNSGTESRFKLSPADNTSLVISPVYLEDEAVYKCHAAVWRLKSDNSTDGIPSFESNIPEEKDSLTRLTVYVPPNAVQLTTFASRKNLSLTCRAKDSKPPAVITWLKETKTGTKSYNPSKASDIYNGKLADTVSHLYYTLTEEDDGAVFSCVVRHDESSTIIIRNSTMVSPVVLNSFQLYFDRLGAPVAFSTYENQKNNEFMDGLLTIDVDPGTHVPLNSTVVLTASAPTSFPEPIFTWWTGNDDAHVGSQLVVNNLQTSETYFVLAQNSVGRAVLSIKIYVEDEDFVPSNHTTDYGDKDSDVKEDPNDDMHGGLILAIVLGVVLFLLLLAFAVWFFTCRKPPYEVAKVKSRMEVDAGFQNPEKPLMRTASTQTLELKRTKRNEENRFSTPVSEVPKEVSDYTRNATVPRKESTRNRALNEHMKDFDENASFIADYTHNSRDNLDKPQPNQGSEASSTRSLNDTAV